MNKVVIGICASLLALSAQISHAGIIDTSNNSFIDTDTGLEWMDFGVNNNSTYNQVVAELNTTWAGWSLATEAQVLDMWHNAFSGKGSEVDLEYSTGSYYAKYNDFTNDQSVHEATFDVMGCNIININKACLSTGFFLGNTGSIGVVYFQDFLNGNDIVEGFRSGLGWDAYRTIVNSGLSTMLVKNPSASVPEASSLVLLALSLLGLVVMRRRR